MCIKDLPAADNLVRTTSTDTLSIWKDPSLPGSKDGDAPNSKPFVLEARFAAAMCLARYYSFLGEYHYENSGDAADESKNDESATEAIRLRVHIRAEIRRFLVDVHSIASQNISEDLTRRRFRLQCVVASMSNDEDEHTIVRLLFAASVADRKERWFHEAKQRKQAARITQLSDELERYQKLLVAQTRTFQRDVVIATKNSAARAEQRIEWEKRQRAIADRQAKALEARLQEVQKANAALEQKLTERDATIVSLQQTLKKAEDDGSAMKERLVVVEETVTALRGEVASTEHQLRETIQRRQVVEAENAETLQKLRATEAIVASTREAVQVRSQELDSAYGHLVALSQVHLHQEQEFESSIKHAESQVHDVRRKLEMEKEYNDELESKVSRLNVDKERLSRKLTKSKELFERERRDREEDQQRQRLRGPVSYINNLHSTSSTHHRGTSKVSSSDNQRKGGTRTSSRYDVDKENRYLSGQSSSSRSTVRRSHR